MWLATRPGGDGERRRGWRRSTMNAAAPTRNQVSAGRQRDRMPSCSTFVRAASLLLVAAVGGCTATSPSGGASRALGEPCMVDTDCITLNCLMGACAAAPNCMDKIKNGGKSDGDRVGHCFRYSGGPHCQKSKA